MYKLIVPAPFGGGLGDREVPSHVALPEPDERNITRAGSMVNPNIAEGPLKPWAILRRHPLGPEVGKHSVNPCLVSGVRNVVTGREPAAQRADRPVLLRFTGSVNRRCREAVRGAHDSKRTVSYDRDIASRKRQCTELTRSPSGHLVGLGRGTSFGPESTW